MEWTKVVLDLVALQAATLLLPQRAAAGDFLAPLLVPIMNATYDHVECGKGTCKASLDYTVGFICECNQGWSQFHVERRNHPHREIKLVRYDAKEHSQKHAHQQAPISLSPSLSLFLSAAPQSRTEPRTFHGLGSDRSRPLPELRPPATALASCSSSLPILPPARFQPPDLSAGTNDPCSRLQLRPPAPPRSRFCLQLASDLRISAPASGPSSFPVLPPARFRHPDLSSGLRPQLAPGSASSSLSASGSQLQHEWPLLPAPAPVRTAPAPAPDSTSPSPAPSQL